MVSIIVFLVYAYALLPLITAQEDHKPCVFPFTYKKRFFSSCTTYGTPDEKLWCATTHFYEDGKNWKWCTTQEYGGNSHGKPCVFPFFYHNQTYYTCIPQKSENPWCATTGSYDKKKKWSYCADTRINAKPIGPCVFPFVFQGKSRSTCVTNGSPNAKPFCSLTDHYDADLLKVPCTDSEPRDCVFPFIYNGKHYCICTRDGTIGGPLWCATTSNYDKDKKWKPCEEWRIVSEQRKYFGGCAFPFTYGGQNYSSCTPAGSFFGSLWCSRTSIYNNVDWRYCPKVCY